MKLLWLYFPRLVWGSGLLVLALFGVALQANATASTLLPQSGGFDVDAFVNHCLIFPSSKYPETYQQIKLTELWSDLFHVDNP